MSSIIPNTIFQKIINSPSDISIVKPLEAVSCDVGFGIPVTYSPYVSKEHVILSEVQRYSSRKYTPHRPASVNDGHVQAEEQFRCEALQIQGRVHGPHAASNYDVAPDCDRVLVTNSTSDESNLPEYITKFIQADRERRSEQFNQRESTSRYSTNNVYETSYEEEPHWKSIMGKRLVTDTRAGELKLPAHNETCESVRLETKQVYGLCPFDSPHERSHPVQACAHEQILSPEFGRASSPTRHESAPPQLAGFVTSQRAAVTIHDDTAGIEKRVRTDTKSGEREQSRCVTSESNLSMGKGIQEKETTFTTAVSRIAPDPIPSTGTRNMTLTKGNVLARSPQTPNGIKLGSKKLADTTFNASRTRRKEPSRRKRISRFPKR